MFIFDIKSVRNSLKTIRLVILGIKNSAKALITWAERVLGGILIKINGFIDSSSKGTIFAKKGCRNCGKLNIALGDFIQFPKV